jgi:acyl-coenzyme A synthetase/AMP-(fatty) acid ligase
VQIPHRAVVHFLQAIQQQLGLTAADVLLAVTTVAFDIAALEVFLPLSIGARVALASRAAAVDGEQLQQLLTTTQATVMQATPATWRLLLAAAWSGHARFTVLCGGDVLPRELAQQLQERAGAMWNLYGPTETTIWSTLERVDAAPGPVPIGGALAQTQLYVLDGHGQPLPRRIPGELYIGGMGVARGYHRHPALTAARFLPDPYSGRVGARLYKTGDLGRWQADDRLEFLGRLDQQVKVRGFRIELGEIEAVLEQHPTVQAAVVVARPTPTGELRLLAYIVPQAASEPTGQELRRFLQTHIPDYMLPAVFTVLTALPLTPNGKVDRRALPAPAAMRPVVDSPFVAPRTPAETVLAGIWAQVLNLDQIGRHDNFFDLGGDSILSLQIIAKANAEGLPLHPRQIFQYQTLAELAALANVALPMQAPQGTLTGQPSEVERAASGNFPLAQLSQEQLEQAFGEVAFEGEDT